MHMKGCGSDQVSGQVIVLVIELVTTVWGLVQEKHGGIDADDAKLPSASTLGKYLIRYLHSGPVFCKCLKLPIGWNLRLRGLAL